MNKNKAMKVLVEVKEKFAAEIGPGAVPMLFPAEHEGLSRGSWSIAWEGSGIDFWPGSFETSVPGVFVEPINVCTIGLYDE